MFADAARDDAAVARERPRFLAAAPHAGLLLLMLRNASIILGGAGVEPIARAQVWEATSFRRGSAR